jgi:hypothetical protein
MALTLSEAQQRVARGAQLLDRFEPDWYRTLDLDRFDLADCYQCVLGQCMGGYGRALYHDEKFRAELDIYHSSLSAAAEAHGFWCRFNEEYPLVEQAWAEFVGQRLAADAEAPIVTWQMRELVVSGE